MTAINVKAIPDELVPFILQTQLELRIKKKAGKYSQSQTVIHIIKEYKKLTEK